MTIGVNIIAGVLLLILGSRMLWLFLGVVGFIAARGLVAAYLPDIPEEQAIAISAGAAALALALAFLVRKIAVLVGGFLGGGYVGWVVWGMIGAGADGIPWMAVVLGGVLGILVAHFLVKFALTVLSIAVGAGLIAMTLPAGAVQIAVFVLLVVMGFAIQAGMFRQKKKKEDHGSVAS
jgi:hypothetical protein